MNTIDLQIEPRVSTTWKEFIKNTPKCSIALDGYVHAAPQYDAKTKHINFDHHHEVQRLATMSSAEQVMYAIKGGLMNHFITKEHPKPHVYVDDPDQDVALALFILENYKLFEGIASIPNFNRLLEIDSRLDITGGWYPMNHNTKLIRQHHWVFAPYSELRKSGKLYNATAGMMRDNLEATTTRIMKHINGDGGEVELDTRHEIYYRGNDFWMANEIGGPDARYELFSQGMLTYINIIGEKENGNLAMTIGNSDPYRQFPIQKLYDVFNAAEGITKDNKDKWGGSNLIGGSPRETGTKLSWQEIKEITQNYLKKYE